MRMRSGKPNVNLRVIELVMDLMVMQMSLIMKACLSELISEQQVINRDLCITSGNLFTGQLISALIDGDKFARIGPAIITNIVGFRTI